MKDLDFDELDRAVNSLMTNVPDSDMSKPEETEKTLEITPTPGNGMTPPSETLASKPVETPDEPVVSPAPTPLATPSPRPPLASRRGGRFMDVVHPSSDMKTPTVPARSAVSRQGVTIAPSSPASAPLNKPAEEKLVTPVEPQPSAAEIEPSTVAPEIPVSAPAAHEKQEAANEWPDPLEMANFKSEPEKQETPAEPEASPPEKITSPQEKPQEEPSPLTSPFLSGTKVEKRPLGGAQEEPAGEPDRVPAFGAKADSDLAIADPNAQLPPTPSDVEPELPEELKGDLMAIEADTTTHHKEEKPEEATQGPSADTPKEEEKSEEATPEQTHKDTPAPMIAPPSDEKLLTAGPTSIPQQYREEPSTGDQDNGAIYDTDTYHQPLTHPAKKKSGWLWIIWIVLILALGAGAGAALYLLGIV